MSSHDARTQAHATITPTPAAKAVPVKTAADADPPLSIGRMVHHVNPGGECQAAIVTGLGDGADQADLIAFGVGSAGSTWRRIPKGAPGTPGHWHWPERPETT